MSTEVSISSSVTNQCSLCGCWFISDKIESKCSKCSPKKEIIIDRDYLRNNPDDIFVFGDNYMRDGHGGAAILRDEPNTYGFVTKVAPSYKDSDFFRPEEYAAVYCSEMERLIDEIKFHTRNTYLISKVGAGLANKYHIFEIIIEPTIKHLLSPFSNVRFLW